MIPVLLAAAFLLLPVAVRAYEEPPFEVVSRSEGFEVRRYEPRLVVETEVAGSFGAARDEAFMRLFRYISGANRAKSKVAMTVPVTTGAAEEGRKVAMTVPVTSQVSGPGVHLMQFFVPGAFTPETVPQPTDPLVRVRLAEERWVAVRRYSGRSGEANYRENQAELMKRLAAAGVAPAGPPSLAVYNGPFTPWFLRRNEVWVPVEPVRQ